jgi:hypothetical protein
MGGGGYGIVYEGALRNKTRVAIKLMRIPADDLLGEFDKTIKVSTVREICFKEILTYVVFQ